MGLSFDVMLKSPDRSCQPCFQPGADNRAVGIIRYRLPYAIAPNAPASLTSFRAFALRGWIAHWNNQRPIEYQCFTQLFISSIRFERNEAFVLRDVQQKLEADLRDSSKLEYLYRFMQMCNKTLGLV